MLLCIQTGKVKSASRGRVAGSLGECGEARFRPRPSLTYHPLACTQSSSTALESCDSMQRHFACALIYQTSLTAGCSLFAVHCMRGKPELFILIDSALPA
ncbi:hypothetical protein BDW69DRAFT_172014 [Aspergillus filifer]